MGEKMVNGFLFLCAISYLASASSLSFGSLHFPKAGFIPIVAGSIAALVSAMLFVKSLLNRGDAKDVKMGVDIKKALLMIGALLLYIVLFKMLGYIGASFIVLLAMMKISQVKGWLTPVIVSVIGSAGFYFVFNNLLGVPLQ